MNRLFVGIAAAVTQIVLGTIVTPVSLEAQTPAASTSDWSRTWRSPERRDSGHQQTTSITAKSDTAAPSHRATITGGILGATIGGLGAAGFVLNATAHDCVSIGPPCAKKNYLLLHTVTITAGAAAGSFIGARVARWLQHRF